MLQQSLIYLSLSIFVVLFAKYAKALVVYMNHLFEFLYTRLLPFFQISVYGPLIEKILLVTLLPLVLVGIPALIYRLIRGRQMPYFIACTWLVWLVLALSLLITH